MIYGYVISETVTTSIGDIADLMLHVKEWNFLGWDTLGKRRFECVYSFYESYQKYLAMEAPLRVPGVEKRFEFSYAVDKELTETEVLNLVADHLAEVYTLAPVTI